MHPSFVVDEYLCGNINGTRFALDLKAIPLNRLKSCQLSINLINQPVREDNTLIDHVNFKTNRGVLGGCRSIKWKIRPFIRHCILL